MRFHGMAAAAVVAAAMLPLFAPSSAAAQTSSPENLAKGKKLYDQAIVFMEAKRYSDACPKLEEVVELVPEGIGGKITLAECYESDGRLVRAYEAFRAAEDAAAKAGQADRQKKAQERATALLPKVSKLLLVVPDAVRALPGLEIRRNGLLVTSSAWSAPIAVEPGPQKVVATATGKDPWEQTVEIAGGAAQGSIAIPASWAGVSEGGGSSSSGGLFSGGAQKKAGVIIGGVGAAGLLGGGIAGVISLVQSNSSDSHCNAANVCDDTGNHQRASASMAGDAAMGLLITGGVLGAAAAVLYLTAPNEEPTAPKAAVLVGPQGIYLRGSW